MIMSGSGWKRLILISSKKYQYVHFSFYTKQIYKYQTAKDFIKSLDIRMK